MRQNRHVVRAVACHSVRTETLCGAGERLAAARAAVRRQDRSHHQRVRTRFSEEIDRAQGCAQCPAHPHGRCRFRRVDHVRRPDSDGDHGSPREERASLYAIPYHRALFAHAGRAAVRPQPPLGRDRRHHGARHRLPRLQLADAEKRGHVCRGAEAKRLQHGLVWQEP